MNAPDLNSSDERPAKGREKDRYVPDNRFTRMFINVGSVDNFTRGDMLRFICDNSGISGQQVGRIDLKGIHTFFEVASSEADTVYNELKSVSFNRSEKHTSELQSLMRHLYAVFCLKKNNTNNT